MSGSATDRTRIHAGPLNVHANAARMEIVSVVFLFVGYMLNILVFQMDYEFPQFSTINSTVYWRCYRQSAI